MTDKNLNKYANRLVNAFLKNKIISPLPTRFTKKISEAQKLRKLCESKIKKPILGFKAAGTSIPVLKKLKEKIQKKKKEIERKIYRREMKYKAAGIINSILNLATVIINNYFLYFMYKKNNIFAA